MADKVTKSLDDIIKDNKANRAGNKRGGGSGGPAGRRGGRGGAASAAGGGGGRFRGTSLPRRQNGGGAIQKRRSGGASLSPRKAASSINDQWTHDLFQGVAPSSGGATKLIVSNLDFGVNDNDIQNLFQEFGRLKKAAVHYDRSARSLGTAEVIFERRADGIRAMNHYNGVSLDGRPMKIEVVGATAKPVVVAPIVSGGGNPRRSNGGGAPGGGGNRSFRGGNRGGRGGAGGSGGRGGRREPKQTKTAEELDAELDAHQHQMQTE